ncbi:hypothetical protein E2C01_023006 [Portunus trituberculatus]|uniref:Uncharacterized protein n=1 Tax=Portunus trituberculatus TaxID=210409 RepID=A0A5B7E7N8_PORTR|nr:hypothetical protein [Portunus trituberculatus]
MVHQRFAHPDVFHSEEMQALSAGSQKVRWDPEELVMMATFEAQNLWTKNINKEIRERLLPHRSPESIKGHVTRCNTACVFVPRGSRNTPERGAWVKSRAP